MCEYISQESKQCCCQNKYEIFHKDRDNLVKMFTNFTKIFVVAKMEKQADRPNSI